MSTATQFAYESLRDGDEMTAMQTFCALHSMIGAPEEITAARWAVLAEIEQLEACGEPRCARWAQRLRTWLDVVDLGDEPGTVSAPVSDPVQSWYSVVHRRPIELEPDDPIWSPEATVERIGERIWVVDGILTPTAFDALHRSLAESTIWHVPYRSRYCGAFLETGLASEQLARIITAIRTRTPGLEPDHRVAQTWAFRCEPISDGIGVHADRSDMNVNIWLTPDAYCRSPEDSGLAVWPVTPPPGTPFEQMNGDTAWCADHVANSGVDAVNIAYAANRAIVFDASQFHASSGSAFTGGVHGRRINLTMLFRRYRP